MKRPAILLAVLLALGGAIAALLLLTAGPRERSIMALAPLSDAQALALARENPDPPRYWLMLLDVAKGVVWELESPDMPLEMLGRGEVAFDADHVYVLFDRSDGGHEVRAITRAAPPRVVWRRPIAAACGDEAANREFTKALYHGPRVAGDRLIVFSGCGTDLQLDVLDLATGQVRWTRAALVGRGGEPAPIEASTTFIVAGDRLVASYAGRADVFDLGSGAVVWTDLDVGAVCDVAGEGTAATLLAVRAGGLVRLPLAGAGDPIAIRGLPADVSAVSCGRYGERVVILAYGDDETAVYAVSPTAADAVLWRTRLPSDVGYVAGRSPVMGALPRFLTVVLRPGATLATLDLESGRVVATVDPVAWHGEVFMTAGAAVIANRTGHTVAVVDAATGAARGAVTADFDDVVLPEHVAGETLWLWGPGWASPDALLWATVDLRTMKAIATQGRLSVATVPVAGLVPVAASGGADGR